MPTFTKITFAHPINASLQVGDHAYYSSVDNLSGIISDPTLIGVNGKILEVGGSYIIIDEDPAVWNPTGESGQYILFSKDIRTNESSLKGYYADVTFQNSSTKKVELFAVSSEIALSSK